MSSPDSRSLNWHYTELDNKDLEIRGRTLFFIIVLFSIILLVIVLFFYTRWVCRYHSHLTNTTTAAAAATLSAASAHAPPQQGLDPESIKKLPIILHQAPTDPEAGAWEETECCICLGEFRDGEKLKVLPGCEHYFHCDCVDKWLTHQSSCPLCRASLKVESSFPKILIQEPPIRIDIQF